MLRNQRLKYKARGASLSCLVTSHVTVGTREKKEEKVSPPEFKGKILRSTPLLPSQGGELASQDVFLLFYVFLRLN
jgi:hypothetical protein